MRIAYVQGGPGLETVEDQAARLRRVAPDRYQIEANPTVMARQRFVELLDSLRPGDELCVTSLTPSGLDAGDTAEALLRVLDHGADLVLVEENQEVMRIGQTPGARRMLEAFAALNQRRREVPPPKPAAAAQTLLSETEIEDIRRLGRAGLSPRRIGLIYRRSPKCISDVLWAEEHAPGPERRHA